MSLELNVTKPLDLVQIVLVEPSHLGNVGSAARAMKTMGLSHLAIVTDKNFITDESMALAKGAQDVLQKAAVFQTLDKALASSVLVAGTSARNRTIDLPLYQPKEAVKYMAPHILKYVDNQEHSEKAKDEVAPICSIVFGRERTGLTNAELLKCDFHINIDANPEYSSLNLAMSVQVLAYELRQFFVTKNLQQDELIQVKNNIKNIEEKASHEKLESFYDFLEKNLVSCGFLKGEHNENVLAQIRRIYAKANLSAHELQILYGTTASMLKHALHKNKK